MAARKKALTGHHVEIVRGPAGLAVYLNGFRIVGDKPWGGGRLEAEWDLTDEDLTTAIASRSAHVKARAKR